jgi:hypothetical protein
MPLVGFGLWKVNNDTCADQVYAAIKAGYRLFDGACGMSGLHSLRKTQADSKQTTATKRKSDKASPAPSRTASLSAKSCS